MYNSCQCSAGNIPSPVKLHSYSREQIVQLEKVHRKFQDQCRLNPWTAATHPIQENKSLQWYVKFEDLCDLALISGRIDSKYIYIYILLLKKLITGANTNSCGEMPGSMNEWSPRKNIIGNKEYTTQQWWHLMHVVCQPQIWIFWCSFSEYYLAMEMENYSSCMNPKKNKGDYFQHWY